MAEERAHPGSQTFKDRWRVSWRKRIIPWPVRWRNPWRRALFERYRFCQRYVLGKRVLDVPCGVGWGTSLVQGTVALYGLDICPTAIQYARGHYGHKARFEVGDMRALPFGNCALDVVLCLEGIEHVTEEDAKRFVKEAARVLVPRGVVIVTSPVPHGKEVTNPYHCHEYSSHALDRLLSPLFTSSDLREVNMGPDDITYYVGQKRDAQVR